MSSILKYIFNKPNSSPSLNNSNNYEEDNDPTIRETLVGHSNTNEEGTVTTLGHHMNYHDLNTSIQDIDLLVESTSIKIREMEEVETFIAVRVRAYKKQLQSFKERYSIKNDDNDDDDDDIKEEEHGHLDNHPNNTSCIGKNSDEFIENPDCENDSSSLSFITEEQKDKYEFYQEKINEIIEKERNLITEIHRLKMKLQDLEQRRNTIMNQKDEHDKLVIASVIDDATRDEEIGLRDRLEANAFR